MRTPLRSAHAIPQTCRTRSHVNATQATLGMALSAQHAPATAASLASRATVPQAVSRMCRTVRATQATTATGPRALHADAEISM